MARERACLIAAGAVLLTLAYPPFHLFLPSFVCLVPAVLLIHASNDDPLPLRGQIILGFWYGVISNGLLLYWMVVALWRYTALSILGFVGTIVLLGGYTAVLFALSGWALRASTAPILLVFPVFWTAAEWLLAHQGDLSFPWLGLGTSLTGFPTIVQVADVVGARGVTLLLAIANCTLAMAWIERRNRRRAVTLVSYVAAGVVLAAVYGVVRERGVKIRALGRMALLQPDVSYEQKWDPKLQDSIFVSMLQASTRVEREVEPDMIVWPESAVPGFLASRPGWEPQVSGFARRTGTALLIGSLHREKLSDSTVAKYNSAFYFDEAGKSDEYPTYNKRRLVPVTERVPFLPDGTLSSAWFGSFRAGQGGDVYDSHIGRFGVLICYESAFEDLSREYRLKGADFLVNITNDSWFGRTSTPYQHASHMVMRAIENRVGVARAANSGISEFVDPLGRAYERTDLEVRTFAAGEIRTSGASTIYTRLGDWVGGTVLLTAFSLPLFAYWCSRSSD